MFRRHQEGFLWDRADLDVTPNVEYAERCGRNDRQYQAQQDKQPQRVAQSRGQSFPEHGPDREHQRDQDARVERGGPDPIEGSRQCRRDEAPVHGRLASRMRLSSSISSRVSFSRSRKHARNGAISPLKKRLRKDRLAAWVYSAESTNGRKWCSRPFL